MAEMWVATWVASKVATMVGKKVVHLVDPMVEKQVVLRVVDLAELSVDQMAEKNAICRDVLRDSGRLHCRLRNAAGLGGRRGRRLCSWR